MSLRHVDWAPFRPSQAIRDLENDLELISRLIEEAPRESGLFEYDYEKWVVRLINISLVDEFLTSHITESSVDMLAEHIHMVVCAAGLGTGYNMLEPVDIKELLANGTMNRTDKYHLANALSQMAFLDKRNGYETVVFPFLEMGTINISVDYQWDDYFFVSLIVASAWYWFPWLKDEDREFLMKRYFYFAIVLDLPVQNIIKHYLYFSTDVIQYVIKDKSLAEALQNNEESVPSNIDGSESRPLVGLLIQATTDKERTGGYRKAKYAEELYGSNKGRDKFIHWLQESIYIYGRLARGELIEITYKEEESESLRYQKELFLLITQFIIGPGTYGWNQIVKYYQEPDQLVPLNILIENLSWHEGLQKKEVVNKFLEFGGLLRANDILRDDEEMIVFHESDGQFHWNDALISGEEKTMEIAK